jgi:hypothetical protein
MLQSSNNQRSKDPQRMDNNANYKSSHNLPSGYYELSSDYIPFDKNIIYNERNMPKNSSNSQTPNNSSPYDYATYNQSVPQSGNQNGINRSSSIPSSSNYQQPNDSISYSNDIN